MSAEQPPVTKYKLTVTIRANSHDEIVSELLTVTRGGYLLASDYYKRDEFDSTGGRDRMVLEHTNPDMTPERYKADLDAWWQGRKAARNASGAACWWLLACPALIVAVAYAAALGVRW